MHPLVVAYIALGIGILVGLWLRDLLDKARGNWDGPENAREAIAQCLRLHPGSSPERIAEIACLTIETVRRELADMHARGEVWMSHRHVSFRAAGDRSRTEHSYHLVGRPT